MSLTHASAPMHEPARAVAELRRALEQGTGLHAVELGGGGTASPCLVLAGEDAAVLERLRAQRRVETRPVVIVARAKARDLERAALREGASEVLALEELDAPRLQRAVEDARDRFAASELRQPSSPSARRREERYAALFASIDEGVCILQMLFDDAGKPVDYLFLETNAAFEAHTGLVDAVGKTARELVPGLEPVWFERYGHVALTGEPVRFEEHAPAMSRWFSVWAMRNGPAERREVALVFTDITARKAAERALRESEERALAERALLDAVLTAAPVGIIVASEGGQLVRMNPANERLWGIAPFSKDVEGYAEWKGWWADGSERDGRLVEPHEWAMSRALAGETVPGDIVTIEPFGHPGVRRTMLNSAAPVRNAEGHIVGAVIAQMDITDRVAAEAAVRESEERFRLVGRATNDVVWDWDLATGRLLWNEAVETHFGETLASLGPTIEGWYERIHPDDAPRVKAGILKALEGEADSWADEYMFRRRDGTYAAFLDRGYIIRDATGRATRMIGSMFDLTERRRAEAALKEGEERFRTLADNISQLAWMADQHGDIFWFNRRWYEYTGSSPDDALHGGWVSILAPEEREHVLETFRHALEIGDEWEETFAMRSKDGELRAFLTRAMPVRDESGRVVRWFGTNTDVEEQRKQAAALREAVQVRDTFLQVAAHELRTPLTALALQLESVEALARSPAKDPARTAKKIAMAVRQTDRLARLIEDLLDVSRITSGRLRLERSTTDLEEVVRETADRIADMAARAGCELRVHSEGRCVGEWDRSRIEQVVTNLVTNAIKYGRGAPVDVTTKRDRDYVELRVQDRGIGISEADQARIFDRFERAVSAEHYGGLGLGLYIAREIVLAHGGRITVESREGGGGTTFTVHLPTAPPARGEPT